MGLLSNLFGKKKSKTPSKNSSYFERENRFEVVKDLKKVLEIGFEPPFNKTEKEITFHGVPLLLTSPQVIKKKFGNPMYILDNSKYIDGHKIFFYKDSVNIYKFLIQYHFIDNMFFFASNKVSSLGELTDEVKYKVLDRIKTKYFGDDTKDIKGLNVKLKDPNGSVLYTVDDVYYHLNYLVDNETTKQLIQKYTDYQSDTPRPSGFKESLEEYI